MSRTTFRKLTPMLPGKQQRGVVLVLCLVLLLVMTVLGVSALNTTVAEEHMARNIQESVRSFQNAETGVTMAALYINNNMLKTEDSAAGPATGPIGLPANDIFTADFEQNIVLDHGEVTYNVRELSSTEGAAPGCQTPGFEQSGGCTRHYEYQSTGTTPQAARTKIYGGGCIYSPAQSSIFDDSDGSYCQ